MVRIRLVSAVTAALGVAVTLQGCGNAPAPTPAPAPAPSPKPDVSPAPAPSPDDKKPDGKKPDKKPDQNPDDKKPDQNPDDKKPDQNPDDKKPDQNPDDKNPDDKNPDDKNPDDKNPDDKNPDDKPDQNPDDKKPDQNPDDKKPEKPEPASKGFKLKPIVVKGNKFFTSDGDEFLMKGIGFPNVEMKDAKRPYDNVDKWIDVLKRISELDVKKEINTVRLYELPPCAMDTSKKSRCFDAFFKAADDLGIYVLVPGTGYDWGWLPSEKKFCHEDKDDDSTISPQGCYQAGGVLGFGQTVVSRLSFPNTLGIVIGNEFDMHMHDHLAVIKAYARDLKSFMSECQTHDDSPSKGVMRSVPLIYASADTDGDRGSKPRAQYLFCESPDVSIDVYGLNNERWCGDTPGRIEYDNINKWVKEKNLPGPVAFTEDGCDHLHHTRTWAQVPDFFNNFDGLSGFVAYAYYGNPDFDMFDGSTAEAKILEDGENFFKTIQKVGKRDKQPSTDTIPSPECPKTFFWRNQEIELVASHKDIAWYNTGEAGWATSCPPKSMVLGTEEDEKKEAPKDEKKEAPKDEKKEAPKAESQPETETEAQGDGAVTVLSDGDKSSALAPASQAQEGFDLKKLTPALVYMVIVASIILLSVAALCIRRGWSEARAIKRSQEAPEELELPSAFATI